MTPSLKNLPRIWWAPSFTNPLAVSSLKVSHDSFVAEDYKVVHSLEGLFCVMLHSFGLAFNYLFDTFCCFFSLETFTLISYTWILSDTVSLALIFDNTWAPSHEVDLSQVIICMKKREKEV